MNKIYESLILAREISFNAYFKENMPGNIVSFSFHCFQTQLELSYIVRFSHTEVK